LKRVPSLSQSSLVGSSAASTSSSSSQPPTRLLIPTIDLQAPIVVAKSIDYTYNGQPATTWQVPDWFAAGWHETSAPPGEPGNTVLNGHRNIYGSVFRDLGRLEIGDEIIVYADETDYHYRVVHQELVREAGQSLEVRAQNARLLLPTSDRRLTLVTCAPLTQSTHRLIIVALPLQMAPPSSDAQ
jgi:sortase A